MLDKLKTVADRYEAIVSQLEDPAVYADPPKLAKLTKEQKDLTPLVRRTTPTARRRRIWPRPRR